MEQVILMCMQTAQEYAQKSAQCLLTEYEMLMYEQLCKFIQTWSKLHEMSSTILILETERQLREAEQEHKKWLESIK